MVKIDVAILLSGRMIRLAGCVVGVEEEFLLFHVYIRRACSPVSGPDALPAQLARNWRSLLSTAARTSHIQTPATNSLTITFGAELHVPAAP